MLFLELRLVVNTGKDLLQKCIVVLARYWTFQLNNSIMRLLFLSQKVAACVSGLSFEIGRSKNSILTFLLGQITVVMNQIYYSFVAFIHFILLQYNIDLCRIPL